MNTPARPSRSVSRRLVGAGLVLALGLGLASPAYAQERPAGNEAGYGALAVLSSLAYAPVKLVYAGLGLIFAGGAYVLTGGDEETPRKLLQRSLRGDYIITPEHLRGERPVIFVGRDPVNEPSVLDGEPRPEGGDPRDVRPEEQPEFEDRLPE